MQSAMWSTCIIVFGLVALTFSSGAIAADEDEEKVAIDKLPKAVVDAVKKMFPKAEMTGATKEEEGDKDSTSKCSAVPAGFWQLPERRCAWSGLQIRPES